MDHLPSPFPPFQALFPLSQTLSRLYPSPTPSLLFLSPSLSPSIFPLALPRLFPSLSHPTPSPTPSLSLPTLSPPPLFLLQVSSLSISSFYSSRVYSEELALCNIPLLFERERKERALSERREEDLKKGE